MTTFQIKTFGCKVNQYDSQLLREKFLNAGLKETKKDIADICVINTCAVTQKAEVDSRGEVYRAIKQNASARVFVTGCSVYTDQEELADINGVCGIFDNDQKKDIPSIALAEIPKALGRIDNISCITKFKGRTRAFVKIQDGCNNVCSYCIVAKARGHSHSRPPGQIAQEVKMLVANGYKEIVLCGICLGVYGRDLQPATNLVKIIETLEAIEGLLRIRLSSIEASDVTEGLIKKLVESKKLCRHLHIPFQSGDDKILKFMNRRFSASDYLGLVAKLRQSCPDIAVTTDIIAGFPNEDEVSFENTLSFIEKTRPSRIHVFSFSPRRDTAAFNLKGRIPQTVVKNRVRQLRALGSKLAEDYCRTFLDRNLSVLIELNSNKRQASKTMPFQGYSDNYIKVYISKSEDIENEIVSVRASKVYKDGLWALLEPAGRRVSSEASKRSL